MTRPLVLLSALALMLSACASSQGQPAPAAGVPTVAPAPTPLTPVVTASEMNRSLLSHTTPSGEESDLPLGAGDLVEVAVFEVPELSNLKLRVPNSGEITLPLIGAVPAAGRTAKELQGDIRDKLRERYMHNPQVSLFVHENKSQRISVIGAVRTGGVFPLTSRLKVADALALAGGLSEDAGHLVYVIRRVPGQQVSTSPTTNGATEQVMTTIDLQSLITGRRELNLPLMPGDVIEVPKAASYYVGGEVNKAGSIPLKARTTLDQAPHAAGGVRDAADWDDIRLYRTLPDGTREVQKFSLNDFEKGQLGPELRANDVVIVGKSGVKAFFYGLRDFVKFGIALTPTP
jgi:polysaccharide export outer membrane protein